MSLCRPARPRRPMDRNPQSTLPSTSSDTLYVVGPGRIITSSWASAKFIKGVWPSTALRSTRDEKSELCGPNAIPVLRDATGLSHLYLHKLCSTESHRREPVDRSIPAYKDWKDSPAIPPPASGGSFKSNLLAQQRKTGVGIERSTTCQWWDSGGFLSVL